jgi:hypothetical protein
MNMPTEYVRLVALNGKKGTCAMLLVVGVPTSSNEIEITEIVDEGLVPEEEGARHIHTLETLAHAGYSETHRIAQVNINKTEYKKWAKKIALRVVDDEPTAT